MFVKIPLSSSLKVRNPASGSVLASNLPFPCQGPECTFSCQAMYFGILECGTRNLDLTLDIIGSRKFSNTRFISYQYWCLYTESFSRIFFILLIHLYIFYINIQYGCLLVVLCYTVQSYTI